jgi:hypothetical protein
MWLSVVVLLSLVPDVGVFRPTCVILCSKYKTEEVLGQLLACTHQFCARCVCFCGLVNTGVDAALLAAALYCNALMWL